MVKKKKTKEKNINITKTEKEILLKSIKSTI